MLKKEILNKLEKFVIGDVMAREVYELYKNDSTTKDMLNNFSGIQLESQYKTFGNFFKKFNQKNPSHVFRLALYLREFIYEEGKLVNIHDDYKIKARAFASMYPDWLHDGAIDYIEKFVEPNMPEGLSEKQISAYIKKQIKALFKYENKKPEFLQSGYWPLDEYNKPLIFQKQINEGEKSTYYFIDPKTGKQETFEEFS